MTGSRRVSSGETSYGKDKLIVALDVNSFEKAKRLINKLLPYVKIFKVGSELFISSGPKVIKYLNKKRRKVFLDLKFYDIPNTIAKSVLAATKYSIFMLTVHISGGLDMLKEAVRAIHRTPQTVHRRRPLLVGVTVLTSKKAKTKEVVRLALLAKRAGLDGVVCSAKETKQVKKTCGENFLVVNPGIRSRWAAKPCLPAGRQDQKRVTTPRYAIKSGADFIVVGRPITKTKNPALATKRILKELE